MFGVAAALVVTKLIRSVGAEWSIRRLLRAGWRDIAAAAEAQGPQDRAVLTGRMMDRLGLLMPRLAAMSQDEDIVTANVLHDLRVGANVISLRRQLSGLPLAAQHAAVRVLAGISAHYRDNPLKSPPKALLDAVDMTIRTVASDPAKYKDTLMALSGMRSMLFADAPPPDVTGWTVTGEGAKQVA